MERRTRFELATFCMASRRTTSCATPAFVGLLKGSLLYLKPLNCKVILMPQLFLVEPFSPSGASTNKQYSIDGNTHKLKKNFPCYHMPCVG